MVRERLYFLKFDIGRFLDHLFMVVFATTGTLARLWEWRIGYAKLLRRYTLLLCLRCVCIARGRACRQMEP